MSLVCVAILLIGTVTTVFTSFKTTTSLSNSLNAMENKAAEVSRTFINTGISEYSDVLQMNVYNAGQSDLKDFKNWDVIAEFEQEGNKYSIYLTKSDNTVPGDNQWALQGIYLTDGSPEVFDPGILNPGEHAVIAIKLEPPLDEHVTARITTSTELGITAQCQITRP